MSGALTAIYFTSTEQLAGTEAPSPTAENDGFPIEQHSGVSGVTNIYRYDIPSRTLGFVGQEDAEEATTRQVSPDGRYYYFESRQVGAVPGGATVPGGGAETPGRKNDGNLLQHTIQLYRYDSVKNVVECISCASALTRNRSSRLSWNGVDGLPIRMVVCRITRRCRLTVISVFFTTPAALVPQDVDGEIERRACR